jgi:small-conductance mechanosensitive channel
MNITQIRNGIMHGNLSDQDLTAVIDAVKYARRNLQRQVTSSLMVGDNVNFTSTKLGRNVTGVVIKIAIKYVTVRTATGNWRVPANMLSKVTDFEALFVVE